VIAAISWPRAAGLVTQLARSVQRAGGVAADWTDGGPEVQEALMECCSCSPPPRRFLLANDPHAGRLKDLWPADPLGLDAQLLRAAV